MPSKLEFFYDYGSPYTYMAWTQIDRVIQETGAELIKRPFLLGGVFKATGNAPPAAIVPKGKYLFKDLIDWSKLYGVGFNFPHFFPLNSLKPMRGALVAQREGKLDAYDKACFEAVWVNSVNISEAEPLAEIATGIGIDRDLFLEGLTDPEIKQALIANTEEAVKRGAFGAPTFYVNDSDMYFGNDRMDFIRRALK